MEPPTYGRRWNPFRSVEMLASLWSPTSTRPVGTGTAAGYKSLFETMRRLIVGRRISVALGRDKTSVTLTVTDFDTQLDMRSLSVGQLDDVSICAKDVVWDGRTFGRATASLHNTHFRPTNPPVLVAAPVDVSLELPLALINELLRKAAPWIVGDVSADDIAELRFSRSPSRGGLQIGTKIDGSTVWLKPRAIMVRNKRWQLPARTPSYPVGLPPLPSGLRITDAHLAQDTVRLSGSIPEWRMELPRSRLEDIISQLNVAGRQPMLWSGPPWLGELM